MKDYNKKLDEIKKWSHKLSTYCPGTMSAFERLHKATTKDEALSTKMKELIALAIAINVRCDGCIAYHVKDALRAGASEQEITEAIGVAVLMGGGPSMIYGCEALEALVQFEELELAEYLH